MIAIIYKIKQHKACMMYEQKDRFSLYPYGENTEYFQGEDDGGVDYILPDGFEIAQDPSGIKHIYHGNDMCAIGQERGRPVIYVPDSPHNVIRLKKYGIADLAEKLGADKRELYEIARSMEKQMGETPTLERIEEEYRQSDAKRA